MNLVFTIVASLGIGFFVRNRSVAVVAFLIASSFLFTFQTLDVLLNWMGANGGIGGAKAFGPFPTGFPVAYQQSELYAYGVVNLVIIAVGIGLTIGANKLAAKRAATKDRISLG
jgi:hypothetical protein